MLSRILLLSILLGATLKVFASNEEKLASIDVLDRFAFGSCNSVYRPQPLWEWIIKDKPKLWIWGGDNVYADTEYPAQLQEAYNLQNNVPGYKKLKETIPIIGTWDDHDYGWDNAGFDLPFKMISQSYFLDFLEVPKKSPRRVKDGIYTSYEFGPPGKKVKVIILDNRYFHLHPDQQRMMLGEAQWQWLEEEFRTSDAQIHFVVTGLSVLSYVIRRTEEWADHPPAFKRMQELIKKHDPKGLVFLTGDKHFASVIRRYESLEFMSSGLTHTVEGRLVRSYVARFFPNSFFGLNYGLVEIDWNKKPLQLALSVRTFQENPIFKFVYNLNPQNRWELVDSFNFPVLTGTAQSFSF